MIDPSKKLRFYGQFRWPVDRILYTQYFMKFEGQGICLECGAADGVTMSSTKFFEEFMGWKAINIEALPQAYAKLIANRPISVNINAALSNEEGECFIKRNEEDELFSSLSEDGEKVRKTTYKKIIEDYGISKLNLMVLDVEGHEKEALEGMVGSRVLPDILCVEFAHHTSRSLNMSPSYNCIMEMGYKCDFGKKCNLFFKKKQLGE